MPRMVLLGLKVICRKGTRTVGCSLPARYTLVEFGKGWPPLSSSVDGDGNNGDGDLLALIYGCLSMSQSNAGSGLARKKKRRNDLPLPSPALPGSGSTGPLRSRETLSAFAPSFWRWLAPQCCQETRPEGER